jgi:hypothetical protein
VLIGGGSTQNYTALLLMLAGIAAGGVAIHYVMIGGRWVIPTALALLLMLVACALVAARKEQG